VFSYLDGLDLVRTEDNDEIKFKRPNRYNTSMIVYNKENGVCKINYGLVNPISPFFSMDTSESFNIVGKWVEKTLKMNVSKVTPLSASQRRINDILS
jgi:hypothetical protein